MVFDRHMIQELDLCCAVPNDPLPLSTLQPLTLLQRLGLKDARLRPLPDGALLRLPSLTALNLIGATIAEGGNDDDDGSSSSDNGRLSNTAPEAAAASAGRRGAGATLRLLNARVWGLAELSVSWDDAQQAEHSALSAPQLAAITKLTVSGLAKEPAEPYNGGDGGVKSGTEQKEQELRFPQLAAALARSLPAVQVLVLVDWERLSDGDLASLASARPALRKVVVSRCPGVTSAAGEFVALPTALSFHEADAVWRADGWASVYHPLGGTSETVPPPPLAGDPADDSASATFDDDYDGGWAR